VTRISAATVIILAGAACESESSPVAETTPAQAPAEPDSPTGEVAATGAEVATGAEATTGAPAAVVNNGEALTRPLRDCKKADEDATCCDYDFGIDPQALAKACGYASYLGEKRTTTTCQMHFDSGRENPTAITLALFEGMSFSSALASHMSGFFGPTDGRGVPEPGPNGKLHFSGFGKLAWAYVDGWSTPRRVAWSQRECEQAKMTPVLAAMADAPEVKLVVEQVKHEDAPRPLAAATHGGAGEKGSLLERYQDRPLEAPKRFQLPANSMRLIVMVLERAAQDSIANFDVIFSKNARYGLPGRRKLRSLPLRGSDGGYTFLTRFRAAGQRFGHDAKFACPPLTNDDARAVAEDGAPMWCTYTTADQLELLVFALVIEDGEARVDYVGFLDEHPDKPLKTDGEPPAPPFRASDVIRANRRAEQMNRPDAVPGGAAMPRPRPIPTPPPKPGG
jgi:hypothetical protein